MCSEVMITNATPIATMCRPVSDMPASGPSSSRAIAGSPIQPSPSEARVIPSWQADRYALRFCSNCINRLAVRLPWLASVSIRDERTPTKANSAATKKPLAATSNRTASSFMVIAVAELMWGRNHSTERGRAQISPDLHEPRQISGDPYLISKNLRLVSYGRTGGTGADWTPVMLRVGTSERLIDARFDVALRLATHCCQFRNYQITSALEHPLFAERQ